MISLFLSTPQGDKNKLRITGPQNGGKHLLEVLKRLAGGNAFSNLDPSGLCDLRVVPQAAKQGGTENKENDQIIFVYPPGRQK